MPPDEKVNRQFINNQLICSNEKCEIIVKVDFSSLRETETRTSGVKSIFSTNTGLV